VGFMNYKFFMLFLLYGVICCVVIDITLFPRFYHSFRPVLDHWYFLYGDLPVVLSYVFCVVLTCVLAVFLSFHLYLSASAMTTIEFKEQRTAHRFNVAHLKFDRGFCGNIMHVFGPPFMWLFPVQPHSEMEGTYCPLYLQREMSESVLGAQPANSASSYSSHAAEQKSGFVDPPTQSGATSPDSSSSSSLLSSLALQSPSASRSSSPLLIPQSGMSVSVSVSDSDSGSDPSVGVRVGSSPGPAPLDLKSQDSVVVSTNQDSHSS